MKQLLTGCLIFSFIKTKQNKKHFFLLSPCCMLCTHWDLRTALVQRRKQAHGVCHLVTEAGFTPSPPDSKTHRWVLLKMDVTVRWGGVSRRALSAIPWKTLELKSPIAGVA